MGAQKSQKLKFKDFGDIKLLMFGNYRTLRFCSTYCKEDSFTLRTFIPTIIVGVLPSWQENKIRVIEPSLDMAERYDLPFFEADMKDGFFL
jgi:hypothetical protein